jgi:hypothetical protein
MTADKLREINMRADMRKSHMEQWYRLYKVLFPNEPLCFSPYLNNAQEEMLSHAEKYLRSQRSQMILQKEMQDMGFQGEIRDRIFDLVFYRFLPAAWSNYAPDGEVYSSEDESVELTHDDDEATEYPWPGETIDPNVISTTILEDTGNYGLQQPPDPTAAAHAYTAPGLAGPSAPVPGAFETQPNIEGIASEEPIHATEIGDPGLTGPGAFGHLTDGDFSRLLWSEGHQAYGTELDLTWNV